MPSLRNQQFLPSGLQKSAMLLITLGPEVSASVFQHLEDEEIDMLTLEIANIRKVDNEDKEEIMSEFYQLAMANNFLTQGGINYAKEILEKALGSDKANDIIKRLTSNLQTRPFDFARKADASQILNFIQNESPQTIALVLSYLVPEQASLILSSLSEDKQAEVARRIALMDRTSPEVIAQVERVLEQKMSTSVSRDLTSAGGIEAIVKILNGVDRTTERTIIEALQMQDPSLAEEIKKRMFLFEDIISFDNRSIQRIIREIDNADLQLALKVASEELNEKIFSNMSKRMAETFKEEMEFMGPVRVRDVEEAQTRIVAIVRRLEESGEIIISRGGDDVIV
jgi:flagellar motor switch protein FliG